MSSAAMVAAAASSSACMPPSTVAAVRKTSASAAGTPSSSQITMIGSWLATASTKSNSSRPATASNSSSVTSWIRGRMPSMRLALKARTTSLRSRSWSGGSRLAIARPSSALVRRATFQRIGSGSGGSESCRPLASSLLSRGSPNAAMTSS